MKHSDVNSIGTGVQAMRKLVDVKIAAGWSVVSYGDGGSTYSSTGAGYTSAVLGANNSWVRVREPIAGRREWTHQRGSTNLIWRSKYSAFARFSGGSPSATRTPSATDEQIILGSGTDASPGFTNFFGTDSSYRVHIIANSVAIGGVFPFVMFCTVTPGITFNGGGLWQEPMAPGSYDPADADPCIVGFVGNGGSFDQVFTTGSKCWLAYGTGSQVWLSTVAGANTTFNGSLAPDLVSGQDLNGRPLYSGSSGGTRIKGYGATMAVKGPPRAYPATTNTATDAYVYLGNVVIPYADNTVPGS